MGLRPNSRIKGLREGKRVILLRRSNIEQKETASAQADAVSFTTGVYSASSTAVRYFQKSATEEICTRSAGLCGCSICGPKEIICISG